MKLSDYVADFLVKENIGKVFGVTGGAIAHIFDSIGKNRKIDYICMQHEQAAAMAADAYARVTGGIGVALATSGPGATNLITGVACSYYDSVPSVFITGQVSTFRLKRDSGVRQIGFQETDVVKMFQPITKYSVLLENKNKIRYELEKAFYIARSGRPGPVLIDIPDDIQREDIESDKLKSFTCLRNSCGSVLFDKQINKSLELIRKAQRPVIIFGTGIKIAKAQRQAIEFAKRLKFPFVLTWATLDLFNYNNGLNMGGFGICSPRPGNLAVQNADLIISIGARLDTHAVGSPFSSFAREAKKIVLDIDRSETNKFKRFGMHVDVRINSDALVFLEAMNRKLNGIKRQNITEWVRITRGWKSRYPICLPEYFDQDKSVNSYVFFKVLSEEASAKDIVIADTGSNLAQTMQGYRPKRGQLIFSAFNHSPMGYSLPAAIGACFADRRRRVICIAGDGGIQMNIQELATIAKHRLPVKIFILNNKGYGMIKQTQDDWLGSRYEASSINKGVAIPNFIKVAQGYGLKTVKISSHKNMRGKIKKALISGKSVFCNVDISEHQRIVPMLKFGRPIEDPNPLLDRTEFLDNMIVKPIV